MEQQNRLKRVFTEHGHTLDLNVVDPTGLDAMLRRKAAEGLGPLIVGGGDGTITSAAKLLKNTGKPLGVLPLGTFNLEARDLKIDLDHHEAAKQLLDAEVMDIDLMELGDECCLCATVIGFYPALAKGREDFHGRSWWKKSVGILHQMFTVATNSPALKLVVTEGGETRTITTRLAAFAPGHYVENIGVIPDRDSLVSGELSAYISEHHTRYELIEAALGYLMGNLLDTEKMTRIEFHEITINVRKRKSIPAMIDGEIVDLAMPCTLRILPKALKVLRPRKPAE